MIGAWQRDQQLEYTLKSAGDLSSIPGPPQIDAAESDLVLTLPLSSAKAGGRS